MNTPYLEKEQLIIRAVEMQVVIDDATYNITLQEDNHDFIIRQFQKFFVEFLRHQAMILDK